jgi:hypothetical protein
MVILVQWRTNQYQQRNPRLLRRSLYHDFNNLFVSALVNGVMLGIDLLGFLFSHFPTTLRIGCSLTWFLPVNRSMSGMGKVVDLIDFNDPTVLDFFNGVTPGATLDIGPITNPTNNGQSSSSTSSKNKKKKQKKKAVSTAAATVAATIPTPSPILSSTSTTVAVTAASVASGSMDSQSLLESPTLIGSGRSTSFGDELPTLQQFLSATATTAAVTSSTKPTGAKTPKKQQNEKKTTDGEAAPALLTDLFSNLTTSSSSSPSMNDSLNKANDKSDQVPSTSLLLTNPAAVRVPPISRVIATLPDARLVESQPTAEDLSTWARELELKPSTSSSSTLSNSNKDRKRMLSSATGRSGGVNLSLIPEQHRARFGPLNRLLQKRTQRIIDAEKQQQQNQNSSHVILGSNNDSSTTSVNGSEGGKAKKKIIDASMAASRAHQQLVAQIDRETKQANARAIKTKEKLTKRQQEQQPQQETAVNPKSSVASSVPVPATPILITTNGSKKVTPQSLPLPSSSSELKKPIPSKVPKLSMSTSSILAASTAPNPSTKLTTPVSVPSSLPPVEDDKTAKLTPSQRRRQRQRKNGQLQQQQQQRSIGTTEMENTASSTNVQPSLNQKIVLNSNDMKRIEIMNGHNGVNDNSGGQQRSVTSSLESLHTNIIIATKHLQSGW